jgi:hypothetical protein
MKLICRIKFGAFLAGLILMTSACKTALQESSVDAVADAPVLTATEEPLPSFFQEGVLRQWASEAEASTSYADPEWGAQQVVGLPNTDRCGDFQTAWASAGSDGVDWLEVKYLNEVHVTTVNIMQSFNPNQVVKVELSNARGDVFVIYEQPPKAVDQPCPYTLAILVERTAARYDTVRITIDQSYLGLGWNEIDAVELIGISE